MAKSKGIGRYTREKFAKIFKTTLYFFTIFRNIQSCLPICKMITSRQNLCKRSPNFRMTFWAMLKKYLLSNTYCGYFFGPMLKNWGYSLFQQLFKMAFESISEYQINKLQYASITSIKSLCLSWKTCIILVKYVFVGNWKSYTYLR